MSKFRGGEHNFFRDVGNTSVPKLRRGINYLEAWYFMGVFDRGTIYFNIKIYKGYKFYGINTKDNYTTKLRYPSLIRKMLLLSILRNS